MNNLRVLKVEGFQNGQNGQNVQNGPNGQNGRYLSRASVDVSAILDVLHLRMRCNLENLSTSGAKCIVSKAAPLMVGSKVCLFFRLSDQYRFFILNGRVIFISPSKSSSDRNEVGVRFIDMNPEVHHQLEDWLDRRYHENHENHENHKIRAIDVII